jgi:hypothetical protein
MKTKLKGSQIRHLVLTEMVKALGKGKITERQFKEAKKIRWPKECRILGTSMKVKKGEKKNVLTAIIYLAPATESVKYGGMNFCAKASPGCSEACLGAKSRRLAMSRGYHSKAWKSLLLIYRKDIFSSIMCRELANLEKRANKRGMIPACRPNGSTDYQFEVHMPELFESFPNIQFYDYTKIKSRMFRELPENYSLTFSRSEINDEECLEVANKGDNIAIVFVDLPKALEEGWQDMPVYNGDESDYRPGDPKESVIGLSVKAGIKGNSNGFIVEN